MHIVATYPYRHQAEIAAALLQEAGIAAAVLVGERRSRPVREFVSHARVAVRDDLAERATEVLRDADMLGGD